MNDTQENQCAEQFHKNINRYVNINCKKCYGRGLLERSFPSNLRLGISRMLQWKDYCDCVKINMAKPDQEERIKKLKEKIEVFPGLSEYRKLV